MVNGNYHSSNDPLVDPEHNASTGVFAEPFDYTTRAVNLKSDGILAVSDILFYRHWLKPTILDPFNSVGKKLAEHAFSTSYDEKYSDGKGKAPSSTYQSWSSDWMGTGDWILACDYKFSGHSTVTTHWSSILQSRPRGDIPVSQKRDLNVNVKGTIYNRMNLRPNDGKWSVTRTTWNIPGTTTHEQHLTVWGYLEKSLSLFSGHILDILTTLFADMQSRLDGIFDGTRSQLQSISTALIMPAGDVYTFLGLDCDDEENLTRPSFREVDRLFVLRDIVFLNFYVYAYLLVML